MKYLIIILFFLSACSGKRGFYKYSKKNPEALAKECAEKFPPKTEFIKGEPVIKFKESILKGDSIPCPKVLGQIKQIYVKCPDAKIQYKYEYRIDTLIKVDSSVMFLNAKQKQNIELQEKNIKELKNDKKSLISYLIFLGIVLIATVYFWIRK